MEEKERIKKTLLSNLVLLMKNQEFYDEFTELLNVFSLNDSNVSYIKDKEGNYIYRFSKDNNALHILFAQNLNDINITYKSGNIIKDMKIKIRQNEINMYKKEKQEDTSEVTTKETNKIYMYNYLIKSTYNELIENDNKTSKFEELLVMKDGGAFLKVTKGRDISYLETSSLKNITFNNRNKDIDEQHNFELSNIERYNDFMTKYEISLLPIRFVDVVYISDENKNTLSGILLSSNSKSIELLVDDDQIQLSYDKIINISCNGKKVYSNNVKGNKKINSIFKGWYHEK